MSATATGKLPCNVPFGGDCVIAGCLPDQRKCVASETEHTKTAAQERPLNTNGGHDTAHIGASQNVSLARGEAPRVPASSVQSAARANDWTLEKAARAVLQDYDQSGDVGDDAIQDLRTALGTPSSAAETDWLEIDAAYSASLEYSCTCGQGEHGELNCPHCNRWEKARAMLKKALAGTPSASEATTRSEKAQIDADLKKHAERYGTASAERVINFGDEFWKQIMDAAKESPWMPPEYMMNDWVADICEFLRSPRSSARLTLPEGHAICKHGPYGDRYIGWVPVGREEQARILASLPSAKEAPSEDSNGNLPSATRGFR